MTVPFHHGARAFQQSDERVLVNLADTSVGGILGLVPIEDVGNYPLNTLILVRKPSDLAALPADVRDHIDSIYDTVITNVVVSLIAEGETPAETIANAVGSAAHKTGVHAFLKAASQGLPKPRLMAAPGLTTTSPTDGVASAAVTTPGTGYVDGQVTVSIARADGDTTGTGATARAIVRADGAIDAIVIVTPGYGYTAAPVVTINGNGAGNGAAATAATGSVMSPVIAEMIGVAEKLGAMVYADGPDGTDEQAVQARQLIGSRHVFFADPRGLKSIDGVNVPRPSSPVWIGLQAEMDRQFGPHYAGSNMPVSSFVGLNRPVSYPEDSNYLNANRVNTFVNLGDGLRAWGVWTCSQDPRWQFVSVVRTSIFVNEGLERAFLPFIGRPMTLHRLDLAVMGGGNALKNFEGKDGMLLPGSSFRLGEGNSPEEAVQGVIEFDVRYEVPAPIVDLRMQVYRNIEIAYTMLFNSVTGEITYR